MNKQQVEAILVYYKNIDAEINLLYLMEQRTKMFYGQELPPEVEAEIQRQREQRQKLAALKEEIIAGLEKLESSTKKIIYYFYILDKKWNEIKRIVHFSTRSCQNKRDIGIDQLKEIYADSDTLQKLKEEI